MDPTAPSRQALRRLTVPDAVLTARDLTDLGISRQETARLVADGDLERVARGVYGRRLDSPTRETAYRRVVRGAIALGRRDSAQLVLAGPAAVVMHDLPLLGPTPQVVHVAAPQDGGRKQGRLIHPVGSLDAAYVTSVSGVCVARPADAVVDTARLVGVVGAVAAADAALRRGLMTEVELADACARRAGTTGVGRARRAARLATPLSESPGESWSAVVMDTLGLPEPQRQHSVVDDDGRIGRVDFWWPGYRLAGEFDGKVKYGRTNPSGRPPEEVLWDEKVREDRLRRAGVRVVRWTTVELVQPMRLDRRLAPFFTATPRDLP